MTEQSSKHEKLNYLEFAAKDLAATKAFFSEVFNWRFTDYGDEYTAFDDQGLEGGFYKAELATSSKQGGALVVFYSDTLEETQTKIESAGGVIVEAIFAFPGGRRFHFVEPSGNEFAVWSES